MALSTSESYAGPHARPRSSVGIAPSASAPVLSTRREEEEIVEGTRATEYSELVRTLNDRSVGYLQQMQADNFMYQHMTRAIDLPRPQKRPQSAMLSSTKAIFAGSPTLSPVELGRQQSSKGWASTFATPYSHRRIIHTFPTTQRFPSDEPLPDAVLVGPGDYAGAPTAHTTDGPMALIRSRPTKQDAPRTGPSIGPGKYNPSLTGLHFPIGEYDSTATGFPRASRQPVIEVPEGSSGDYEPAMVIMPRAPGHRGLIFNPLNPQELYGGSGRQTFKNTSSTEPGVAPGSYEPKMKHRYAHEPHAIISKTVSTEALQEPTPGPTTFHVPARPPTTVPAGTKGPTISFAAAPWQRRYMSSEAKADLANRPERLVARVMEEVTPAGRLRRQEEAAERFKQREARLREATTRRTAVLKQKEELALKQQEHRDARPTPEMRAAQLAMRQEEMHRQSTWASILKIVAAHQVMARAVENAREKRDNDKAARIIANQWKRNSKFNAARKAKDSLCRDMVNDCLARYVRRCREKRRITAIDLVRTFLADLRESSAVVLAFRKANYRIKGIQRGWRRLVIKRQAQLEVRAASIQSQHCSPGPCMPFAPWPLTYSLFSHLMQHLQIAIMQWDALEPKRYMRLMVLNESIDSDTAKPGAGPPKRSSKRSSKQQKRSGINRTASTTNMILLSMENEVDSLEGGLKSPANSPATRRMSTTRARLTIPFDVKRSIVHAWLRQRISSHKKECIRYERVVVPRMREEFDSSQESAFLDDAKNLLAGNALNADRSGPLSLEKLRRASLQSFEPPPYFHQRLPKEELTAKIDEALARRPGGPSNPSKPGLD